MSANIKQLEEFYNSPLGRIVKELLLERIRNLTKNLDNKRVLGLGFAIPYLRFAIYEAKLVINIMPARIGAVAWPEEGDNISVLADPLEMPLPDSSIDVIIGVHAFEHVADCEELMHELWRIGAPNAELIIIVPRRSGLWAQSDKTPFGSGHPFSKHQLEQLLKKFSFEPIEWNYELFFPPSQSRFILRSRKIFAKILPLFGASFAGAMCVRAKKQLYPAIAKRQKSRRLVRSPILKPQTAKIKARIIKQ